MIVIRSQILEQFNSITFGFSTKIGLNRTPPYHFNMSHSVGDDPKIVDENRIAFAETLGLNPNEV